MFRRKYSFLPKDPVFPADLTELGFFITDKDQVRQISDPEKKFQYVVDKNDRVNEVRMEAMNACLRKIVLERLTDIFKLDILPLPIDAPAEYVPILISPDLSIKRRVIVIFPAHTSELGIFSHRTLRDEGINHGSAIDLFSAVFAGTRPPLEDSPGVILTNPGQLLWYRGGCRAVGYAEWQNLPRASAVHECLRIDPVKNKIEGHENFEKHVIYNLERVVEKFVSHGARIDIIGVEWTGRAMIRYLAANWARYSSRIGGICLANPQHNLDEMETKPFRDFMEKRCKAYFLSANAVGTPVEGSEAFGCDCVASGEELYAEKVIVKAGKHMANWLAQLE